MANGKTLSNKKIKQIIVDYVECNNYSAVAREHGISVETVRRIVKDNIEFVKKCEDKKEEASANIIEHMNDKIPEVISIMDKYLKALQDDDKINLATLNQITTALGTLIDKWVMINNKSSNTDNDNRQGVIIMPSVDIEEGEND